MIFICVVTWAWQLAPIYSSSPAFLSNILLFLREIAYFKAVYNSIKGSSSLRPQDLEVISCLGPRAGLAPAAEISKIYHIWYIYHDWQLWQFLPKFEAL